MWLQWWQKQWETRRGITIGLIAGFLLGIIYLAFGFWDMLIFGLIVYTGYYIGKRADNAEPLLPEEDEWRRILNKWRGFR